MWLLIVGGVTTVFICIHLGGGANAEGNAPPPWAILLFALVFWGTGLGMAYAWMRMRFTRYLIAVEPHQLSIQRQLFKKKKTKITRLTDDSKATLVESYSENDVPVYCIEVRGEDDKERFGTALDLPEKEWIVDTINRVICPTAKPSHGRHDSDDYCDECGTMLMDSSIGEVCPDCGKVFEEGASSNSGDHGDDDDSEDQSNDEYVEPLNPSDLRAESLLRVDRHSHEELSVSYAAVKNMAAKVLVGGFFAVVGLAWSSFASTFLFEMLNGFQVFVFIMVVIFMLAGLFPIAIACIIWFGRVKVTVNHETLTARAGLGIIAYSRRVKTDSIDRVVLSQTSLSHVATQFRQSRGMERFSDRKPCTVYSSDRELPLTPGTAGALDHEMCGVIVYHLNQLGY
jgi:hypothetical protein